MAYGENFNIAGTVFTFSPTTGGNSTVTQLAAAATFTGTVESVVNQQSYSILFFSDQNATITLKQYIDAGGTKLSQQLTFAYTAGSQFARSGVMNGNYFQVLVQNTGGSTTTTLQLDTAYGTIPSATQLNNSPTSINEINGTVVSSNVGNADAGTQRTVIASNQPTIPTKTTFNPGGQDVFGALVSTSRQPQINIQFNTAYLQTLVNLTSSGGASGLVSPTTGFATFSSSTATTAAILAQSPNIVSYQSGSEVFAEFTADFTTPTNASSYQRIGLYNTLNGFFIGYNGTSFVVGSRLNGSDTTVAQASWNVDTLLGSAGSTFTRNGVIEAIDFTKFNIYRVRFGWLGIATAFFEVLSADGVWVTFHRIFYPNTILTASIATPNLPITLEVSKTGSDATNLQIGTACWAAGITGTIVPQSSVPALRDSQAVVVTPAQQTVFRTTFSKVIASGVDSAFWNLIQTGSGQTIAQSGGNLVINAQTTLNSETIIRSNRSFTGSFLLRAQTILSQRNANNNFFIELVDIIGDNLVCTVNSATSITVTFPATFTVDSTIVGHSMYVGAFNGFTGVTALGGRYTIASVAGQAVTFTVASFVTGAGNTGTCNVFGWNYHQLVYTTATATNVNYDTQRRGWNNGATIATINTTASPGHMAIMGSEDGNAFLADQLIATGTTLPITQRATRVTNLAEETTPLFLQIRSLNANAAPTNTTWTIGMISVENFATQPVNITNARAQGVNTSQNVSVLNTPAVTVSSGTITTVTTLANGQTAHSSASTGSPLRIGARVVPLTIATVDATLAAGDASDVGVTSGQQLIIKEGATSELDFNIPVSSVGTTVTVQGLIAPSATASVRNYIKSIRVKNNTLGAAGNLWILDSIVAVTSIAITTGLATTGTHDLRIGDAIVFTALAAGTGVTANQIYYVTTVGSATTFNFAATPGGTNVVPSVAYTGTSMYRVFDQFQLDTTAGTQTMTYNQPLKGIANTITNFLIPVSLTSGSVFITVNGYRGF
jgi:hypothetical protein